MEEYVSKIEFNSLKQEVDDLKNETSENKKILQQIDKKIDIIGEKIANGEKMDELKIQPLEKRISKIESSQDWLWKSVLGSIIGLAIKIIFDIAK